MPKDTSPWTDELVDRLRWLDELCMSNAEIAEALNRTERSVACKRYKLGLAAWSVDEPLARFSTSELQAEIDHRLEAPCELPDATPIQPGKAVAEALHNRDLAQADLARRTGLSDGLISRIIAGKRPVTRRVAIAFEQVLGMPANYWMAIQRLFNGYGASGVHE